MGYDQWKKFYNNKNGDVCSGWGDQLTPYLVQLQIHCIIIFRYHHVRKKNSRKMNSSLFSAAGCCELQMCPVTIEIEIESEPKHKRNPCIFKVRIIGDANHDSK